MNTEFNAKPQSKRNPIVSDPLESRQDFIDRLEIGDIVTGHVKMITEYGIFIGLGPLDGLLHMSKILDSEKDVYKEFHQDREIDLYVFSIDRENSKLGLSQYPRKSSKIEIPKTIMLEGSEKPYFVGTQLKGYAQSINESGIHFINADGFRGFIPNRAISCDPAKIEAIKESASFGEELIVKINNINGKNKAFLEIVEYFRPNLEAYFHFKLERDVPFEAKIIRIDSEEIFLNVEGEINAVIMKRNLPAHYLDLDLRKEFATGQVLWVKSKGYDTKLLNVYPAE